MLAKKFEQHKDISLSSIEHFYFFKTLLIKFEHFQIKLFIVCESVLDNLFFIFSSFYIYTHSENDDEGQV